MNANAVGLFTQATPLTHEFYDSNTLFYDNMSQQDDVKFQPRYPIVRISYMVDI